MGGRLRFILSGGAPLSSEVRNFMTVVFSTPIFEAYALTETSGILTCTAQWDVKSGHVGGVLPCLRLQIRDVPYLKQNQNKELQIGEVYVKGNSVFQGYFKNPSLTAEAIDKDGWLRVGDLAILHNNGAIEIIERVDELKKLQNG